MTTYNNLEDATNNAILLSRETGYSAIIKSKSKYYVESEPPFIRNFETLIAEFDNGKIVKVN